MGGGGGCYLLSSDWALNQPKADSSSHLGGRVYACS